MKQLILMAQESSVAPARKDVSSGGRKRRRLVPAALVFVLLATTALGQPVLQTWSGSAGDTFWSSDGNWSPLGVPGPAVNVRFINDGAAGNSFNGGGQANNVVDGFFTTSINSLAYVNLVGFHNTQIQDALIVGGTSATDVANVADDGEPSIQFVGSGALDGKDDSVYASILGNALTVSNRNANLGVSQISQSAGLHRATLDMRELNSFVGVVAKVLVGHNFTQPDFAWRPTGELYLAKTNAITTGVISVSDAYQNAGATSFIHLGSSNALYADAIRIGMHKCVGVMDFSPGLVTPSVTFRNAAGTGRQMFWALGDEFDSNTNLLFGFFTSNQAQGTMDLTGASVDALVDRIILGRGQLQRDATVRNGDGNGTLIFGGGTIDVNAIEMGIQVPGRFIGGSVGNGILTMNNDAGVGPALLTVRSNLVMAVQQPGNTDPNGSTAVITVNNGSTLAVAGDIIDGGGVSTINLNSGGTLDMQPPGDNAPGNVSVDTLNLNDGSIVHFSTIAVSAVNLLGLNNDFPVQPGQAIAPAGVGTAGTLRVNGSLTLRGDTLMDISKRDAVLASDLINASVGVDLGGTLKVTFSGNAVLAVGDRFTLFASAPLDSAPIVQLPPPGAGLAWANGIFIDGSIEVIDCSCGEPKVAPTLRLSTAPTTITLSWPTSYSSFALRIQSNSLLVGVSTNWGRVAGVLGNQLTIPRASIPANASVFFQLFQQ